MNRKHNKVQLFSTEAKGHNIIVVFSVHKIKKTESYNGGMLSPCSFGGEIIYNELLGMKV